MKIESHLMVYIMGIKKMLIAITLLGFIFFGCYSGKEIKNPYEEVNWTNHTIYKANFHTHTTISDGRINPQTVVDKYHRLGYQILAITDHNEVTWPWTEFKEMKPSTRSKERFANGELQKESLIYENRDPHDLQMIAIQANELSKHHHIGSFFNDHNGTETVEESLIATQNKNGLTIFFHPGRYQFGTDWYLDYIKRFDHIVGIEIFNQGDRYPKDRQLWDSILSYIMPLRPVWGFSNDDMHSEPALGRNYNLLILPNLTKKDVRKSMKNGTFFFVYNPANKEIRYPIVKSINVKNQSGKIKIRASGYDSINWISEGTVVNKGSFFESKKMPHVKGYVRAEIFGQGGIIIGTQPFGIIE
jgi:hypothetical protein